MNARRWLALGGVAGPAGFVSAWLAAGAATPGYSPLHDAISRLAADGAPHRGLMTAGMVGLGLGVPAYATALRPVLPGPTWLAAAACGVATLGVAATPLDTSTTVDRLHAAVAVGAYATLALTPWFAAGALAHRGQRGAAVASRAVAVAAAACLATSLTGHKTGLFQRAGLTTLDTWIAATAVLIATKRWAPRGEGQRQAAAGSKSSASA